MNTNKSKNKLLITTIIVAIVLIIVTFRIQIRSIQDNNTYQDKSTVSTADTLPLPTTIPEPEQLDTETPLSEVYIEDTPENPMAAKEEQVETTNETLHDETTSPHNEEEKNPTIEELTPNQQKVINAGYGIVVELDTNYYGVLTHGDGCVNGKKGGEILREYLAEKGLVPQNVSGGWIDPDNDWYCWVAKNIIKGE